MGGRRTGKADEWERERGAGGGRDWLVAGREDGHQCLHPTWMAA